MLGLIDLAAQARYQSPRGACNRPPGRPGPRRSGRTERAHRRGAVRAAWVAKATPHWHWQPEGNLKLAGGLSGAVRPPCRLKLQSRFLKTDLRAGRP